MSKAFPREREDIISLLLSSVEERFAYTKAKCGMLIPSQIRALRLRSNMPKQKELAAECGMRQSRISELETPVSASMTVKSLIRIASALNVGLIVKFVSFSEMIEWENNHWPDNFSVTPLPNDKEFIEGKLGSEPVPVEGMLLPQLDPSEKNVASAKDWLAILSHDSKSLQIALLSAEESRLEREDQLREAIAQRDAARKSLDEAGTILGKICVYGTLIAGEKPIDPPEHAAVSAILSQITRAEKAEAALATERARADRLQERLNGSIQIGKDAAKSFLDSKK